jgi:hypothetical protein
VQRKVCTGGNQSDAITTSPTGKKEVQKPFIQRNLRGYASVQMNLLIASETKRPATGLCRMSASRRSALPADQGWQEGGSQENQLRWPIDRQI